MSKIIKKSLLLFVFSFVLWSCEKDDNIENKNQESTFPFQVSTMSKSDIINSNAGNEELFTTLSQIHGNSFEKSGTVPDYTIIDNNATVITDDTNSFTSYTFATINTIDDGILRNIVVTDMDDVFTTYLVTYSNNGDGTMAASYTVLSNDDSGLLKSNVISVTNCETIGYNAMIYNENCSCYREEWTVETICNTTTYMLPNSFDFGGSGGGGGTNTNPPNGGSWGVGFPISGGGSSGGGGFVTLPNYTDDKEALMNFSNDPSIKQQIKDWLILAQTDGDESGTEWRIGPDNIYSPNHVPLEYSNELGVYFGTVTSNRVVMRNHVHRLNNNPLFSGGDLVATLQFYKDKISLPFPVQNNNTTSMLVSRTGVYAIRIKDGAKAVQKLQDLLTIESNGKTKANNLHQEFYEDVVKNAVLNYSLNNPGATSIDPNSTAFLNYLDDSFALIFEDKKFHESLVVFKARLDANNNVNSWYNLTY